MSIHSIDVIVECDKCGGSTTVFDVDSKDEVKDILYEDGWTFRVGGVVLCPSCGWEEIQKEILKEAKNDVV